MSRGVKIQDYAVTNFGAPPNSSDKKTGAILIIFIKILGGILHGAAW